MFEMLAEATKFGVDEALSIVGAVYMVVAVIVAITPNETDNRWLKKFQGLLGKVNFVTGLDLKRGVKKYGPK